MNVKIISLTNILSFSSLTKSSCDIFVEGADKYFSIKQNLYLCMTLIGTSHDGKFLRTLCVECFEKLVKKQFSENRNNSIRHQRIN